MRQVALLLMRSNFCICLTGREFRNAAAEEAEVRKRLRKSGVSPLTSVSAGPSQAHLAVLELHQQCRIDMVLSTTTEGLHRRAGIPRHALVVCCRCYSDVPLRHGHTP